LLPDCSRRAESTSARTRSTTPSPSHSYWRFFRLCQSSSGSGTSDVIYESSVLTYTRKSGAEPESADDWMWCEMDPIVKEPIGSIRFVAEVSNDEFDEYGLDPIKYDALVKSIQQAPVLIYHAWRTREPTSKA